MLYVSLLRFSHELSLYDAHRLVWRAFPRCGDRPFLFNRRAGESLLVQSRIRPDWSFLDESVSLREKTFDTSGIEVGDTYAFYLCANPTVKHRNFGDRRVPVGSNAAHGSSSRMDDPALRRRQALLTWLERQGGRFGFTPRDVEVGHTRKRRIRPDGRRPLTIHAVTFAGRLHVDDPAALAAACASGIGRGKAFGFGLLMIRPLSVS